MNPRLKVNFVTGSLLLKSRIEAYTKAYPSYEFFFSEEIIEGRLIDVFVLPAVYPFLRTASDCIPEWAYRMYYGESRFLRGAFFAGADDYLKDPWTPEELCLRLSKVEGRVSIEFSWGRISILSGNAISEYGVTRLTGVEWGILATLTRQRGTPVPKEILMAAAGCRAQHGSRAVDVHICSLRRKLDKITPRETDTDIIRVSYGGGYFIPSSLC